LPADHAGRSPRRISTRTKTPIGCASSARAFLPVEGAEDTEIVAFRTDEMPGEHVALADRFARTASRRWCACTANA
jgi:hypothetical protein